MPRADTVRIGQLNLWFGLLIVLLLGAAVRFMPIVGESFPLNDGALFAQMSADLIGNGFALPRTTTYNGLQLPFAYPPLAFYLTGALSAILDIDPVTVLRWLPPTLATLSVLAAYLLAEELLRSRWRGLIAAGAYALMTRSYLWLIVGGGVTRALGVLFALLALREGVRMMREHRPRHVASTAFLSGLTLLSHPQAGVFLAVSLGTLWAFHYFRGQYRRALANLTLAGIGGLLVASPWLIAVTTYHGLQPLLSAGQTGMDLGAGASQLFGLAFSDATVFDLMTALGILGILVRIARLQFMVPTWFVLTILIDPRAGTTYATIPLALSVVPVLGELMQRLVPGPASDKSLDVTPLPRMVWTHRAGAILLGLILFVSLRTAARTSIDPATPLFGLRPHHADAMEWARLNTPGDAQFVVVTELQWERDYFSEWFPVLAERHSLATVQGTEWGGLDAFLRRLAEHRQLQRCADLTDVCIRDWFARWSEAPAYIFVAAGRTAGPSSDSDCCAALRQTLRDASDYQVVYDGSGATIFEATPMSRPEVGRRADR